MGEGLLFWKEEGILVNDDDSGLEFFLGEGAFLIAYGVQIVGLL